MPFRAAAIQMTSSYDVNFNLSEAAKLIEAAVDDEVKLVVLPEMFAIMGLDQMDKVKYREEFGHGLIQNFLQQQAKSHGIWLVGGTIPLAVAHTHDKVYAASLVYNAQGECIARYNKIHLFDVNIPEKQESYNESQTTVPGQDIVVVDTPVGKLGLAVCYDIRFPEFFRRQHELGVEIIALPAAFTTTTGAAHWEVLVRARAIENQVYIIAAAQSGKHSNKRLTHGHSMIVNPWGQIKACLPEGIGMAVADCDLNYLHQIRGDFPVLKHIRFTR